MRRSIYIVIDQKDGEITNPCRLVESEWEEVPQAVKVSATVPLHPRNLRSRLTPEHVNMLIFLNKNM